MNQRDQARAKSKQSKGSPGKESGSEGWEGAARWTEQGATVADLVAEAPPTGQGKPGIFEQL